MRGFYIAADYARKDEVAALGRLVAEATGWEDNSRWANRPPAFEDAGIGIESDQSAPEFATGAREAAELDVQDVLASEVFIQLTTGEKARGGRHVELGIAIATKRAYAGNLVVVSGTKENVFHWADGVEFVEGGEAELLTFLRGYAAGYAAA